MIDPSVSLCLCGESFDGPASRAELLDLDRHDPLRTWAVSPPVDLARAERILQRAVHPGIHIISED